MKNLSLSNLIKSAMQLNEHSQLDIDKYERSKHISYNTKDYYAGTMFCSKFDKDTISAFSIPKRILDRKKALVNEDLIRKENIDKLDKLFKVSQKVLFTSFLTLTCSSDTKDVNLANINLKENLKKITDTYNNNFNLSKIEQVYKVDRDKAILIREDKIQKYIKKDVEHWVENQIKAKAFYDVCTNHNIILRKLKNPKVKKYVIQKVREEHKDEILQRFQQIVQEEKKKRFLNVADIEKKTQVCEFRIRKQIDKPLYYFWALEFTKQDIPHIHIILNKFIPNSILEDILGFSSTIRKNDFLYDGLCKNKKMENYFTNCVTTLDKYNIIEEILKDDYQNADFSKGVISYIAKYMDKDSVITYKKKLKFKLKGHINRFSQNLTKDFKEIFKPKETGYKKELFTIGTLNSNMEESKPNQTALEFKKELEKLKKFNTYLNRPYLDLLSETTEFIDNMKRFNFEDVETLKYLESQNLDNQDFSRQSIKLQIYRCFEYLNELNKHFFVNPKTLQKIVYETSLNSEQKDIMSDILTNKQSIQLLRGNAGCGKSYFISRLNHLKDEFNIVYLTSKNKPKQSLFNEIKQLGFDEEDINVLTISKFLLKQGRYKINSSNCRFDKDKKTILIIDEVGQVSYEDLNAILEGVYLDNIQKIILCGDEIQDKSFYGDNLIFELQDLDLVNTNCLQVVVRQETKETADIVNSFKDNKEFKGINDIFNFYKQETKLKSILNQIINDNFQILTNSHKARNYINSVCKKLNLKYTPIICNENFNSHKYNKRFINGEDFLLIEKKNDCVIIESRQTLERFELPKNIYYKYFVISYALTIDKVQGLGYNNVAIFYDEYAMQHLATQNKYYVGLSRAKKKLKIYFQSDDVIKNIKQNSQLNNDLIKLKDCPKILQLSKTKSYLQLQQLVSDFKNF